MEKWVLLCPDCGELFPIPRVAERDDPVEISRLPRGITLSFAPGGFMIKANLRSLAAFFIVPFTIAWAGFSMAGLYGSQIAKGKFEWFPSLFGLPFLVGSIFLVSLCLLTVAGTTIVRVDRQGGLVSTGVGFLRRRRRFDPAEVKDVEHITGYNRNGSKTHIVLTGERRIKVLAPPSSERELAFVKLLRQELRATRADENASVYQ
jgi:hypothetical protein